MTPEPSVAQTNHQTSGSGTPQPVDAVITWVDGADPKLKAKQAQYFTPNDKDDITSAGRFADSNEIYYCISAILKNAPFINRIFIVTDDQNPAVIEQIKATFGPESADKITAVDHKDIFAGYEQYLPTFNSISIETVLHRIPDLSERYIYFNDDFMIAKPVDEADFFVGNRPVLRGKWRKESSVSFSRQQRQRMLAGKWYLKARLFSYKECQFNAYKALDMKGDFFWHDHTPHPFYRPDVDAFYDGSDSLLRQNIQFRIRDSTQFDPMSLANGLDLQKGGSIIRNTRLTYLKASAKKFQQFYVWRKRRSFEKHDNTFLCVQALNESKPAARQAIFNWLDLLIFGSA